MKSETVVENVPESGFIVMLNDGLQTPLYLSLLSVTT